MDPRKFILRQPGTGPTPRDVRRIKRDIAKQVITLILAFNKGSDTDCRADIEAVKNAKTFAEMERILAKHHRGAVDFSKLNQFE